MAYGLMDDEIAEWERQQQDLALQSLADPSLGAPPSYQQPSYQAPPHAEMAPLEIDNGPDWTDALGAGTTALAALADLGFNKGRSTGNILASGGAFAQARSGQRLAQTKEALGYEEKRADLDRSNRYTDLQYANLAARTAATQQRGAGGITPYQQSQLDAKKETAARLEQERQDRLDAAKAADADRDSAREDRNQQFTLSMEDRKAAREATQAERAAREADRQQYQADRASDKKEVADDKTTREFAKDTETSRSMALQLRELDPILSKYESGDIPGTGKLDQFIPNAAQDYLGGNSEDATRIDQLKTGLQAEYRHAKTGAAASIPEDLRLMIVNGTRPNSTEQEFRLGMQALKKAIPLQIKAYGANRESQARAVLREQGLEDFVYGGPAAEEPPPEQNGRTNYGPDADHPSNLGVGPGGRSNNSVPKFSPTPGGGVAPNRPGKQPYGNVNQPVGGMSSGSTANGILLLPSGRPAPGTLTPEQIQAVISAGGRYK